MTQSAQSSGSFGRCAPLRSLRAPVRIELVEQGSSQAARILKYSSAKSAEREAHLWEVHLNCESDRLITLTKSPLCPLRSLRLDVLRNLGLSTQPDHACDCANSDARNSQSAIRNPQFHHPGGQVICLFASR